jgi:DNA-binding MarR family transcriptional regulator
VISALDESERVEQAEHISAYLPLHITLITRLLRREITVGYSWAEAGLLRSLKNGPWRITELAELEGLAQPTTTLLVKRLEKRGFVRRERQPDDQRVVLVWLTDAGKAEFEDLKTRVSDALRRHLAAMPDQQLNGLAAATDALADLVTTFLSDGPQREAAE